MLRLLIITSAVLGSDPTDPSTSSAQREDRDSYAAAMAQVGRDPDAHVRLALWCEARGLEAERVKHLSLAILNNPAHSLARGLMGLVAYRGQWQRPEAVAAKVKADEALSAKLAEYNARRAGLRGTAEAHWDLAFWCERHGLDAEARAHHTAVTRLDPARDAAWKRLGCRKVGGRWVTEAQLAAEKDEAEAQRNANQSWRPLLAKWRNSLDQKDHRAEAEQGLANVTDPYAVPSVWEVFGRQRSELQLLAVQIFGQIDASASSRALALLATWGGSNEVRQVSSQVLRRRDPREYAGFLLAQIGSPIRYQTGLTLDRDGFFHRVLHVEGKAFDTLITYGARIGASGNPNRPPADSWRFKSAVQFLEGVNTPILLTNSAVYAALNRITEQNLPEDAEPWREWYYDVQGYAYTRPRPVEEPRPTAYFSMPSCFAAGTLVKTIDGLRPIESIRVGDQVLAQNTRTGALNFRAVTTVHQPARRDPGRPDR